MGVSLPSFSPGAKWDRLVAARGSVANVGALGSYAYDAVWFAAHGLDDAIKGSDSAINGSQVVTALRSVRFLGASGYVQIAGQSNDASAAVFDLKNLQDNKFQGPGSLPGVRVGSVTGSKQMEFTVTATTVLAISPKVGSPDGGDFVTVTSMNIDGSVCSMGDEVSSADKGEKGCCGVSGASTSIRVMIGGNNCTDVCILSTTELRCISPGGRGADQPVVLFPDASSTGSTPAYIYSYYAPIITNLARRWSTAQGSADAQKVVVTGTHFIDDPVYLLCRFGDLPRKLARFINNHELECDIPTVDKDMVHLELSISNDGGVRWSSKISFTQGTDRVHWPGGCTKPSDREVAQKVSIAAVLPSGGDTDEACCVVRSAGKKCPCEDSRLGFELAIAAIQKAQSHCGGILAGGSILDAKFFAAKGGDDSVEKARQAVDGGAMVIIGEGGSTSTIAIAKAMGMGGGPVGEGAPIAPVPLISPTATSTTLEQQAKYPFFLRMSPSNSKFSVGISALLSHFSWTRIATIATDDAYSNDLINGVEANLAKTGGVTICSVRLDSTHKGLFKASELKCKDGSLLQDSGASVFVGAAYFKMSMCAIMPALSTFMSAESVLISEDSMRLVSGSCASAMTEKGGLIDQGGAVTPAEIASANRVADGALQVLSSMSGGSKAHEAQLKELFVKSGLSKKFPWLLGLGDAFETNRLRNVFDATLLAAMAIVRTSLTARAARQQENTNTMVMSELRGLNVPAVTVSGLGATPHIHPLSGPIRFDTTGVTNNRLGWRYKVLNYVGTTDGSVVGYINSEVGASDTYTVVLDSSTLTFREGRTDVPLDRQRSMVPKECHVDFFIQCKRMLDISCTAPPCDHVTELPCKRLTLWQAYLVAVDHVNQGADILRNSKVVPHVHYVDESNPAGPTNPAAVAQAVVAERAKKNDGSLSVFLTTNSGSSKAIAQVGAAASIPVISITATSAALTNTTTYPYFARVSPSDKEAAVALVTLIDTLEWRSFGVIYPEASGWGKSFVADIKVCSRRTNSLSLHIHCFVWPVRHPSFLPFSLSRNLMLRLIASCREDAISTRVVSHPTHTNHDVLFFLDPPPKATVAARPADQNFRTRTLAVQAADDTASIAPKLKALKDESISVYVLIGDNAKFITDVLNAAAVNNMTGAGFQWVAPEFQKYADLMGTPGVDGAIGMALPQKFPGPLWQQMKQAYDAKGLVSARLDG